MDETTAAPPKPERPAASAKKVKRIAGKIASNEDQAAARKRRSKLAINILRDIADGKTVNPQAVARAFFKGAKQAKKDEKLAVDDDASEE